MGNAAEKIWATHFAPGVILLDAEPSNDTAAPATKEVPRYKWIHCANEGLYKGHHKGPFMLTRETFESFTRNLRENPQFRASSLKLDDGSLHQGGVEPVVQFDYEHASEVPPWEGDIPERGAPAQGWVLDLAVRNDKDGKAQLWAFAELLDDVRAKIKARQYRWVSIAFSLKARDWKTEAERGPTLSSIAFTNHPYMLDLEPLLASRRASQPGKAAVPSSSDSSEAPGGRREPTRAGATMEKELRERVCKALKINLAATDDQLAGAVDEAVSGASNLGALLEALGVPLTGDALKLIPQLRDAKSKLEAAVAELNGLLSQEQAADAAIAQTDVAAAMTAGKLGDAAKVALGVHRSNVIAEETKALSKGGEVTLSVLRAGVKAGREKFLASYGVADPGKLVLSVPHVAGPNGQQLTPPVAGTPIKIEPNGSEGEPEVYDLRDCEGANKVLKLRTFLLRKGDKSFSRLNWQNQIKRCSELSKTAQLLLPENAQ